MVGSYRRVEELLVLLKMVRSGVERDPKNYATLRCIIYFTVSELIYTQITYSQPLQMSAWYREFHRLPQSINIHTTRRNET
jgi:hypothetical protein